MAEEKIFSHSNNEQSVLIRSNSSDNFYSKKNSPLLLNRSISKSSLCSPIASKEFEKQVGDRLSSESQLSNLVKSFTCEPADIKNPVTVKIVRQRAEKILRGSPMQYTEHPRVLNVVKTILPLMQSELQHPSEIDKYTVCDRFKSNSSPIEILPSKPKMASGTNVGRAQIENCGYIPAMTSSVASSVFDGFPSVPIGSPHDMANMAPRHMR